MICKVKDTIEKYNMLHGVTSVAVGLSGGADSMCLVDILTKLKVQYDIVVKAVHINHNIRGEEALRDEMFVKEFCSERGIELLTFSVDVPSMSSEKGISEEECGRLVRYSCFQKAECDVVATAHNLTDSVETVVFNLIRGTGSKGLSGIPAKRDPNIIRPLINCTRDEIEAYCDKENLSYVTDSTNLTDDYSRNFIRHRVLPLFSEINSDAVSAISKLSEIAGEESAFIEDSAKELLLKSKTDNGYKRDEFIDVHPAVRKRAFRLLLGERMSKPVEEKHISLCEDAFLHKKGKIELSKDLYISLSGDIIHFYTPKNCLPWSSEIVRNKALSLYGEYELVKSDSVSGIDMSKVKGELSFSSRKEGDKIYLRSRKVTKSLKKLFNEMKIPSEKRNTYAVLRDGENVVWVEGIGTDGNYLPDEKSDNIFVIIKDGQKL